MKIGTTNKNGQWIIGNKRRPSAILLCGENMTTSKEPTATAIVQNHFTFGQ
jgi:hypothetical protein